MKAVVAALNQEKALVGAFSVITKLRICFGWNFLKLSCYWPGDGAGSVYYDGDISLHPDTAVQELQMQVTIIVV